MTTEIISAFNILLLILTAIVFLVTDASDKNNSAFMRVIAFVGAAGWALIGLAFVAEQWL